MKPEGLEIKMHKNGDVVIITASRDAVEPLCIFQIKSYKLQAVYALDYDELAMAVADYDRTVEKQQKLILDLHAFEREQFQTEFLHSYHKSRQQHLCRDKKPAIHYYMDDSGTSVIPGRMFS